MGSSKQTAVPIPTPMRFDKRLRDRQPQPSAAHFSTAGRVNMEKVKDVGEVFGGDALPIIGNFHTNHLPLCPPPPLNLSPCDAHPIPQQILQHLDQ